MTNETLYLMLNSNSKGYGLKQRAESFLLNTGNLIGELSPKFDLVLNDFEIVYSDVTSYQDEDDWIEVNGVTLELRGRKYKR